MPWPSWNRTTGSPGPTSSSCDCSTWPPSSAGPPAEHGELPDLIRLNRPVLASDALARLVMARLPAPPASGLRLRQQPWVPHRLRHHDQVCGGRAVLRLLVALVWRGTRDRRRTPAGRGLAGTDARPRRRHRPAFPGPGRAPRDPAASLAGLQQALDGGRLDAAIDVLALLTPSSDLLPVLVDLVTRTLSPTFD